MIDLFKDFCSRYELTKVDIGKYANIKVGPMKFQVECYDIKNLGRLSFMKGKALFGLMKMDTVMLTIFNKDVPFFSYDRIKAMKNDTLIIELYKTCKEEKNYSALDDLKNSMKEIKNYQVKPSWFDNIRMKESASYKDKNKSKAFDDFVKNYLEVFNDIITNAEAIDVIEKRKLQASYVNGMLEHGGVSTNMFIKKLGLKETKYLYENILFNTKL